MLFCYIDRKNPYSDRGNQTTSFDSKEKSPCMWSIQCISRQVSLSIKASTYFCLPTHSLYHYLDNILERLVETKGIEMVRIGHPARVSWHAVPYTLDLLCYSGDQDSLREQIDHIAIASRNGTASSSSLKKELNQLEKIFKKKKTKVIERKLAEANVIFSTLNRYVFM
jgi:hypothetical protein